MIIIIIVIIIKFAIFVVIVKTGLLGVISSNFSGPCYHVIGKNINSPTVGL